jgi:hypothetical protein
VRPWRLIITASIAAIGVIREAVGEVEAAWARQLGSERFALLRGLLLELDQLGLLPPELTGSTRTRA